MKKFQSGFDVKIVIKVCPEFFNQGPVENSKSRFDENISIKVCSKFSNRDRVKKNLICPLQISRRNHFHKSLFQFKVWLKILNQSLPGIFQSRSG